ncbi:lysine--tRNA ligase [Litorivicinus sp.]|nr:lysine--tRNA ligase [Litorivicinus sp.]MDC1240716.1 lysine--tRNA ligase [Litorivicinus sp.]
MTTETNTPSVELDENKLVAERYKKLALIRDKAQPAFPNDFRRTHLSAELIIAYGESEKEALAEAGIEVFVCGRIMLRRIMGKASFLTIQDVSGRIQLYARSADLQDGVYDDFKSWDLGDIVGGSGILFRTNTGELSVHLEDIRMLTKSLRPLPDKHKGLADTELRYRERYVDLMTNEGTRKVFTMRSQVIAAIRQFFESRQFLEVETPMLQVIPGGATAKPFVTHHNALDIDMYLRIAPELYLKRLVVGGFERVFEVNRNFRNEGLSSRHNPEFTMLEFYWAYADYRDLIVLTESLIREVAEKVCSRSEFRLEDGSEVNLKQPFHELTVKEAILKYCEIASDVILDDLEMARSLAHNLDIKVKDNWGLGKIQIEIFEAVAEQKLMHPTFVTEYPAEVSPLARRNDDNPFVTDRFEFFIGGRELANGFSELNDAEDQAARFREQVLQKASGDGEAMHYDEDYVRALEYGLPPTAGEGIGIDRLVMFFAEQSSIRDVILFPTMRPKT